VYKTSMVLASQVRRRPFYVQCTEKVSNAQRVFFSLFLQRLQHFTAIDNFALVPGFYYVCVDFNPQPAAPTIRPATQQAPSTPESDEYILPPLPAKGETPQTIRVRRDSSVKRGGRAPSVGPRSGTPVPTMSGFYFHQNSEPCVSQFVILCHCFTDGNDHRYQQLSLNHVPECTSSSFEFR
jgi:glucose-induced degradation protein 4